MLIPNIVIISHIAFIPIYSLVTEYNPCSVDPVYGHLEHMKVPLICRSRVLIGTLLGAGILAPFHLCIYLRWILRALSSDVV